MNLDQIQILPLFFVILGICCAGLALWWGRKKSAENRGLDERYQLISAKSQSASWKVTLGVIYVLFIIHLLGVQLTVASTLGILLLVHLASWTFSAIYYQIKL
ncbi:hypothetical protein D3C78_980520 [compost metagenome]